LDWKSFPTVSKIDHREEPTFLLGKFFSVSSEKPDFVFLEIVKNDGKSLLLLTFYVESV
jgi:hypothetical protein